MREQAIKITYDSMTHTVTIDFENGTSVTLPLQVAVALGDRLVRLIRPVFEVAEVA